MSASCDLFSFPPTFDIQTLPNKDRKVCVVSIMGKSRMNGFATKASILNPVLEKDVFMGPDSYIGEEIQKGDIECYYDNDAQVVYLHQRSLGDTHDLVGRCQQIMDSTPQEWGCFWEDEDFKNAKTVLLLLSISHIVVLCHPGNTFDIGYVKLFRCLDTVRLKLQTFLTETLQGLSISKDWLLGARPCSPRMLFYFDTPTFEMAPDDVDSGKPRALKNPPLKRLVHNIEDQIYRILRKSRIITNISNNSLFAVPANQEFAYVNSRPNEATDPITVFLHNLRMNSASSKDLESPRSRSYATNRRGNQSPGDPMKSPSVTMFTRPENSFKEFLWQHIDQAFTKGFDDNVGRNPVTAVFEMASCETWFAVAMRLYKFFFAESPEGKVATHLTTLRSLLETDVRFSENRCSKILPLAESAYQQDLPQHYITSYHQSKLAQAKRVFAQFARGPAFEKYLKQLEEACESWWKAGHQQCEAVSLTGNLCQNPLHRLPSEDSESSKLLPVLNHSSQLKTKAACNCGRTQGDKEDPFDHKYANYEFYKELLESCCGKLETVDLPVFKPSTSEVRAGQVAPPASKTGHAKLVPRESTKSEGGGSGLTNLSLALSLGQSGGSDITYGHRSESSPNPDASPHEEQQPTVSHTEKEQEGDKKQVNDGPSRQHSTTEYLPSMIHTEAATGLLPKFCSWSLCSVGPASLYVHTQGLDFPGFLQGSNFLLPWDITVRTEKEKWPTVSETSGKKTRQRRIPVKEVGEVTLRVFLGDEYECPRGHRFFCSGPEKIIKVSSTSTVKDNANKLLTLDMPLYCQCHCRSPKGSIAQLMRIYVVTPEGPIKVQLKPQVRPSPNQCPVFYPGNDEPITLPPGQVWVLRLPYVYLGDHGVYHMPSDPQQLSIPHITKGLFQYKEVPANG